MSVDWLIKLWDKGGAALVMIVMLFFLARFIMRRGVRALDHVATTQMQSMQQIASAVQESSAAQVEAIGNLVDRVSRMEGKVDTLGQLALREVRPQQQHRLPQEVPISGRAAAVATVVEVFDEDENTPVHPQYPLTERSQPIASLAKRSTPAQGTRSTPSQGTTYSKHRPPTQGGGGKR